MVIMIDGITSDQFFSSCRNHPVLEIKSESESGTLRALSHTVTHRGIACSVSQMACRDIYIGEVC
jgi:hypothetical protein